MGWSNRPNPGRKIFLRVSAGLGWVGGLEGGWWVNPPLGGLCVGKFLKKWAGGLGPQKKSPLEFTEKSLCFRPRGTIQGREDDLGWAFIVHEKSVLCVQWYKNELHPVPNRSNGEQQIVFAQVLFRRLFASKCGLVGGGCLPVRPMSPAGWYASRALPHWRWPARTALLRPSRPPTPPGCPSTCGSRRRASWCPARPLRRAAVGPGR